MVLTLSSLLFFQLCFPCKASGGGGGDTRGIHRQVAPHLPAMFPRIEHANMQLSIFPTTVAL